MILGGNFPCKVDLALFCIPLLATISLRYFALMSKNYSHNIHTKIIIIANYHNTIINNQIERRGREKFGDFVLIWSCPVLDESTSTNNLFSLQSKQNTYNRCEIDIPQQCHLKLSSKFPISFQFSKFMKYTTHWHHLAFIINLKGQYWVVYSILYMPCLELASYIYI